MKPSSILQFCVLLLSTVLVHSLQCWSCGWQNGTSCSPTSNSTCTNGIYQFCVNVKLTKSDGSTVTSFGCDTTVLNDENFSNCLTQPSCTGEAKFCNTDFCNTSNGGSTTTAATTTAHGSATTTTLTPLSLISATLFHFLNHN